MNPFSALLGVFTGYFMEGNRAHEEAEQAGPEGRWNDKWLDEHGYEAQYQAYCKAHNGSSDGFVYVDPGDPPPYPGKG